MSDKVLTTKTGKLLQHPGSGMAYSSYKCRCAECVAFNTLRNAERRARRREMARTGTMPEGIKHGRATASNWGCKCEVCVEALRVSNAAWYSSHYERVGRKRGEDAPLAKLTNAQVLTICERLDGGERSIALAREYGVHTTTIGKIKRGEYWSHLTGRGRHEDKN